MADALLLLWLKMLVSYRSRAFSLINLKGSLLIARHRVSVPVLPISYWDTSKNHLSFAGQILTTRPGLNSWFSAPREVTYPLGLQTTRVPFAS